MACTLDFRFLDEGVGGQKNKRKRAVEDAAEAMDTDGAAAAPSKKIAIASTDDPDRPSAIGRPSYDGVIAGKVSGRKWKQPRQQRSSAMHVTLRRKSLDQRNKEKGIKKAFQERVNELKEEIRLNKVEKRKKREEREKKKKENILRTGTKLQKITNPKTLKKIAKSKQRKNLKVVHDALINKSTRLSA